MCHFILAVTENSTIFCFKSAKSQGVSIQIFCMSPDEFTFFMLKSSDMNIRVGAYIHISMENVILTFLLDRWVSRKFL